MEVETLPKNKYFMWISWDVSYNLTVVDFVVGEIEMESFVRFKLVV